jgi:hypothetical protein
MNETKLIIAFFGIPLGLCYLITERLLGCRPKSEGFADLARDIGVAFYCGIITWAIILTLLLWLVIK